MTVQRIIARHDGNIWAVGEEEYDDDTGDLEELEDGPVVEVVGTNPRYRSEPLFPLFAHK